MFILVPYRNSCQRAILSTGIINKSICGWLCTFFPYAAALGRCYFSHKHSKKHEEQKLRVMFILISWCLSIQHDFLSCLVAEAGTKKPKTTILSWHFFTKKPIKILCIYVSLCLDEMHLNIGIIDIGMIPCPEVFHTQDPHSLKIPCRLLVHERMRERVS